MAGLPGAPVGAKLVLHASGRAGRIGVVAERRTLALDAHAQDVSDGTMQATHLVGVERIRAAQWMDLRSPQGLVHVDVSEARHDSLVEQRDLDRSAASLEPPLQVVGAKRRQRLGPDSIGEIRIELFRLQKLPRPEASDVAI